ncbi:hypothetical protein [Nocardia sp. NPDC046763]|uniref:hypothetical protein n=1 Tax=Nocardia sp. NPDC046763 TaxID=3155256 RepID=UPI0033E00447
MPKHLITVASIALAVVAVAGCGSHHSSPLTPPTSATSVPVFGGGQIPDVIDVPTTTPSTSKAR